MSPCVELFVKGGGRECSSLTKSFKKTEIPPVCLRSSLLSSSCVQLSKIKQKKFEFKFLSFSGLLEYLSRSFHILDEGGIDKYDQ